MSKHEKIRQPSIKEASFFETPNPLPQNEEMRSYREKKKEYYDLYQKLWMERRKAEAAWAEDKPYDPYWLDINPDDLTEEDFFYFKLVDTGRIKPEEARETLEKEYWPRVKRHLDEAAAGTQERMKRLGREFNLQDFHMHNSRFNFYQWLIQKRS